MKDRSDLELDILNFANFSDQIRLVCEYFMEGKIDEDKLISSLEGIAILIELQQDKTFDSFKQTFKLDEYSSRAV
jgi:hypothetical protein